jgi:hypothetical protein
MSADQRKRDPRATVDSTSSGHFKVATIFFKVLQQFRKRISRDLEKSISKQNNV